MENIFSKVLVTGAAGLIGSAVTRLLLENCLHVIACDNLSFGEWRYEDRNLIWEVLDISESAVYDRLTSYGVDAVIHCAAHPGGLSIQEPSENVRVNTLGSMRVFEWCAHTRIPVVYLSSSIVYGEQSKSPITEDAILKPATIYAVCKVACEDFLKVLANGYGLQWTALRLFSTYGAGHKSNTYQGIVNVFLTQLMAGNRVIVKGSLNRVRDLLYVEDAARAIIGCLFEEKTRGCVLNVGTGISTTVGEIIEILCGLLDRNMDSLEISEIEPTVGDPHYNVANIDRLVNLTGFKPTYDVHLGLQHMIGSKTV